MPSARGPKAVEPVIVETIDLETMRLIRPARIDGLRDRTNEVWRPLLAIAELAGEA